MQGREFLLIERVAETLAAVVLKNPLVDHVDGDGQEAAAGAGARMGRRADHARPGRRALPRSVKVVSNTAVSLDGRINTRERRFTFFGSTRDHARMSRLRAEADAVLVGGATFRNWPHPSLPDDVDRGAARGRSWNVVVTRSLDVPLDARLSRRAGDPAALPHARRGACRAGFARRGRGVAAARASCRCAWILERLARRGVERLLVEAGGDLLFQFLAADALDEMHITLCPLVVGGPAPTLVDGAGFDRADVRRLRLLGQRGRRRRDLPALRRKPAQEARA